MIKTTAGHTAVFITLALVVMVLAACRNTPAPNQSLKSSPVKNAAAEKQTEPAPAQGQPIVSESELEESAAEVDSAIQEIDSLLLEIDEIDVNEDNVPSL